MARDSSYRPNVYRERGGDRFVIDSGGTLQHVTGGAYINPVRTATQSLTLATDGADSGVTIVNQNAGSIFTLPSATTVGAGVQYTVVVGTSALAASGSVSTKIRPQSADKILGGSVASMTDGDVLTLQGATDDVGDFARVQSDGNVGWYVIGKEGTWSRTTAT